MDEKSYEIKILELLSESPKTFTELLKAIIISRPILTKHLDNLEKLQLISKKTRKSPYEINKLNFDRSPLYPKLLSAYLFGKFHTYWMNEMVKYTNILSGHGKVISDDDGRIRYSHTIADNPNPCDEGVYINPNKLLEDLERDVGRILLNIMFLQSEKNIDSIEIINNFIRFLSVSVRENEWLKERVKNTDMFKDMDKISSKPFDDFEKEIEEMLMINAYSSYVLPKIQNKEEIGKYDFTDSFFIFDSDFFKEIGFPFDRGYKNLINQIEKDKIIDKIKDEIKYEQ